MIDLYTKTVLTIIAIALVSIALQNTTQPAVARLQNCGTMLDPCHVTNTKSDALWVMSR